MGARVEARRPVRRHWFRSELNEAWITEVIMEIGEILYPQKKHLEFGDGLDMMIRVWGRRKSRSQG